MPICLLTSEPSMAGLTIPIDRFQQNGAHTDMMRVKYEVYLIKARRKRRILTSLRLRNFDAACVGSLLRAFFEFVDDDADRQNQSDSRHIFQLRVI